MQAFLIFRVPELLPEQGGESSLGLSLEPETLGEAPADVSAPRGLSACFPKKEPEVSA